MSRRGKCPRCVGEFQRIELAHALLHHPRKSLQHCFLQLSCRHERPSHHGYVLRTEVVDVLPRKTRESHQQQRIELLGLRKGSRRTGDGSRREVTHAQLH